MGKKQHQKDKLYLTCTEWKNIYGGKKDGPDVGERAAFRRLPFYCCSLSMQPFTHPYCTVEGAVFDIMNIVPFLKQYGKNPVSGKKLSAKELVKLVFHKNSNDKYHCPITFKIFNENTHIVAVRPTGNVYSYEAVERLNLKPKFFKDLISDEEFNRKDIITIQDPDNLDKFNFANFFHVVKNIKVHDAKEEAEKQDPRYKLKCVNSETSDILNELDSSYKPAVETVVQKKLADAINAAHYSQGQVAASFTSTSMDLQTQHKAAIIDESKLLYERVKKNAYVRLRTNLGDLNLELYSSMIPKACENFLRHCQNGYYDGTIFHRSIRNFIIQGGDPTGTGEGGDSIWGGAFKDHFKPNLTHKGRGVLSMANSGPDTNKSQFFFTYRSANHLDNKHTVFGHIVGGLDTLDKMERIKTDKDDRPVTEIHIEASVVFVDPYQEAQEVLDEEREQANAKSVKTVVITKPELKQQPVYKQGIGKYINSASQKRTIAAEPNEQSVTSKKKKKKWGTFGNFSSW